MLDACLHLVSALEALSSGRTTAPEAEARLLDDGPQHVFDPDALLGLDPLAQVPLRRALARVEHGLPAGLVQGGTRPVWALLLPRPGRLAGLRGPVELNRSALDAGAVVLTHDGSLAWLGSRVGAGVQWRLARAERPLPPPDPRETARQFAHTLTRSAQALAELDVTAGARPGEVHPPVLGDSFGHRSQQLLDRAWLVLQATDAAMAAQHEVLHSHAVLARETRLRELAEGALDAVSAAASWPSRALEH